MEEFLTRLYSYDNFTTYLIISIVVLVILFLVILFFGKKDQKNREIEATKKLMKINEDNLQDQFVMNEEKTEQEKLENDTIVVPNINDLSAANMSDTPEVLDIPEPVLPNNGELNNNIEPKDVEPIENIPIQPEVNNSEFAFKDISEPISLDLPQENNEPEVKVDLSNEPVFEKVEEKPFTFDDINFNGNVINPDNKENNKLEETSQEFPSLLDEKEEISVPQFNYDEILKNVEERKKEEIKKGPEVFSSVYVPHVEEKKKEEVVELPKIEKEVDEEEEFELPTLKSDAKEEEPEIELPNYNLDDISGESYNIK